ncbi:permease-like cell division protein FtsX [Gorillibacterium massiliense]|uniref:permease-like cell division protein FtsX n=1 Tax=Gorillibacterium massiliense TaxID=1280390 RepID=UPI0004B49ECE|nr:permease-like cell division protein FtsX [Gorillibacterium massiliense]
MKISTYIRHFREGGRSIIRNGWMSFASISSITISLFILGLFVVFGMNINHLSKQLEDQVSVRVYLEIGTKADTISDLQKAIEQLPEVKGVTFISKEEALQTMRERLGNALDGMDGADNPLNDSYNVELKEPRNAKMVADQISAMNDQWDEKPINKVDFGENTVTNLFKFTKIIRWVGVVFIVCLVFTSMFLISNTIKLTILARNREIRIMKLVGATNNFIRWPFFVEGALTGFIGALIPTVVILIGYGHYHDSMNAQILPFGFSILATSSINFWIIGLLMGVGLVIGIWGSLISVRKFLKV